MKGLIKADIESLYPVTVTYTPVNCDWRELGYEGFTVVQPYSIEDQRFKDEAEEYGGDAEVTDEGSRRARYGLESFSFN